MPYTIHADGLHAAVWSQNKLYSQYFLQTGITSSVINVCNFYFLSHHYKYYVSINLQFQHIFGVDSTQIAADICMV